MNGAAVDDAVLDTDLQCREIISLAENFSREDTDFVCLFI